LGILLLLSNIVSIYGVLCFIRIILTWVPSMNYNKFTLFLGKICDPYLNIFRNIKFFRIGYMDFSPAIGMGVIVIVSSLLKSIALQQRITVGGILAAIISMLWSIVSSVLSLIIVLMIIRLIVLLFESGRPSVFWHGFDSVFNPMAYKISSWFSSQKKQFMTQKKAYIIGIVVLIVFKLLADFLLRVVVVLLYKLPI